MFFRISKSHNGLNLAEVLISIVFLTVAVLTLIEVFISGFDAIYKGNMYNMATNFAKDRMEQIKLMRYYQVDPMYDTVFPFLKDETRETLIIDVTIGAEQNYGATSIKYKIITVDVYSGSANKRKSVRVKLESIVTSNFN